MITAVHGMCAGGAMASGTMVPPPGRTIQAGKFGRMFPRITTALEVNDARLLALAEVMKGRTTLVVAHRLSTVLVLEATRGLRTALVEGLRGVLVDPRIDFESRG